MKRDRRNDPLTILEKEGRVTPADYIDWEEGGNQTSHCENYWHVHEFEKFGWMSLGEEVERERCEDAWRTKDDRSISGRVLHADF